MNNPELIPSFLAYLRTERGLAENTVLNYENDLRQFAAWLKKSLKRASRFDVQAYLSDLLAEGATGRTAARHLASLRQFFSFLIEEGEIERNPTRNLPVPKSWKKIPKSLHLGDLEKMLAFLRKPQPDCNRPIETAWMVIRDRALLLSFFSCGLRASELARLKLEEVDLEARAVKVWDGKGGKDGVLPLNPLAIAGLEEYLQTVRPKLDTQGSPQLFLSRLGKGMTRMEIWKRVSTISGAALGCRFSPHTLRHGFATALIEGGADIRDVQVLMRHAYVDTTAIYIHTDLTYLRRIYYASHPRARIASAQNQGILPLLPSPQPESKHDPRLPRRPERVSSPGGRDQNPAA